MGCFAYSNEEGTYAYKHYEDTIPQEVKDRRVEQLMDIQQAISAELMAEKVGTIQRVIIDRQEGDYWVGRTQYDSPEVDCEVLIKVKGERLKVKGGDFVDVKITKAEEFDLYGDIC